MKLPNWEGIGDLHEGPRKEAILSVVGIWITRHDCPRTPEKRRWYRRMAREYVSQIRLIDDAQGLTREERGESTCHHSAVTKIGILRPNGMLWVDMECSQCGDLQVGAHHYASTMGGAR